MTILEIAQNIDEETRTAMKIKLDKYYERGSEMIGWIGSSFILTAYVGSFDDMAEFWLNIVGSIGLLVICWRKRAYQPVFLNSAWIVGSIYKFKTKHHI